MRTAPTGVVGPASHHAPAQLRGSNMPRSSYPGQGDTEYVRIEGFYQLIAAILRRVLEVDAPPPAEGDDER